MRRISLLVLLLLALALVLGASACSSTESSEPDASEPEATQTEPEEGSSDDMSDEAEEGSDPAEALVEAQCSLCHTTERVWAAEYDRAEWETTVDRMKANGAVISDEDYETIVSYLSGE
jgi:cytochrome c5